jgi:NAD(P)-dependent dehydrogenase (short-subunit alcohol dehydrogenase family)
MTSSALQLAGRIAVVTGAASGIGEACARKLFSLGSTVVISDVNEERGNAIVHDLKSNLQKGNKADALFVKVDMSNGHETNEFSGKVLDKFGSVCALNESQCAYQ